jgi:hypothetical protein
LRPPSAGMGLMCRHIGVEIGKQDFIGKIPLTMT